MGSGFEEGCFSETREDLQALLVDYKGAKKIYEEECEDNCSEEEY